MPDEEEEEEGDNEDIEDNNNEEEYGVGINDSYVESKINTMIRLITRDMKESNCQCISTIRGTVLIIFAISCCKHLFMDGRLK